MIMRTVRMTNLENVIETHAHIWLVGVFTPRHLLVEGACFIDGILESFEFEVAVASGGGLFFALFQFVCVGVTAGLRGVGCIVVVTACRPAVRSNAIH